MPSAPRALAWFVTLTVTAGCASDRFSLDVEQTQLVRAPGAIAYSKKGTISASGDDTRLAIRPATNQGEFTDRIAVESGWNQLDYRDGDDVSYVVWYDPKTWTVASPPPGPVCVLERRR